MLTLLEFNTDQIYEYLKVYNKAKFQISELKEIDLCARNWGDIFPEDTYIFSSRPDLSNLYQKLQQFNESYVQKLEIMLGQHDGFKKLVLEDPKKKFYNYTRVYILATIINKTILYRLVHLVKLENEQQVVDRLLGKLVVLC